MSNDLTTIALLCFFMSAALLAVPLIGIVMLALTRTSKPKTQNQE